MSDAPGFVGKRGRNVNMKGKAKKQRISERAARNRNNSGISRASRSARRGDDDDFLLGASDSDDTNLRDTDEGALYAERDSDDDAGGDDDDDDKADPYAHETAEEQRLRMAKQYLEQLEMDKEDLSESDDGGQGDAIAHRLHQDVLQERGKLLTRVADKVAARRIGAGDVRRYNGHKKAATCITLTHDDSTCYTGGKDGAIIRWDVETGAKTVYASTDARKRQARHAKLQQRAASGELAAATSSFSSSSSSSSSSSPSVSSAPHIRKGAHIGHSGHVLAVSVSHCGRYLASGGQDRAVNIWDTRCAGRGGGVGGALEPGVLIKSFIGHRDAVTGLAFRRGAGVLDLYSGSADRTLKVWNVADMAYVETLYGHQSGITACDVLYQEKVVTVGQDRTLRVWRIADETQLLFRGHAAAIDTVSLLNEERYITGSEDGALALWTDKRKKPVCVLPSAHTNGTWVTAVAAQQYSDFAVSGSSDGMVRLWDCGGANSGGGSAGSGGGGGSASRLTQIGAVPVAGYVNGLAVSVTGRLVVAALGNEHRMGRWTPVTKGSRNGMAVIDLRAPQQRRRRGSGSDDGDADAGVDDDVGAVRTGGGGSDSDSE